MPIESIAITDREQWLKLRLNDVTASAAGALLGEHEYLTGYGLWLEKAGKSPSDGEMTEAQERGIELEPIALRRLRKQQPTWNVWNPGVYLRDTDARVGATPDAFVQDPERGLGVVQFKSVQPYMFRKKWRTEEGGVEPPLWIAVQAMLEAHLARAQWAAVGALVISYGIELHMVDVPIKPGVIRRIYQETEKFWQLVASGETPSLDYARDADLIAQVYDKDDGSEIDLTGDNELPEVFDQLLEAREDKANAAAKEKTARAELLSKIGNASLARLADGRLISAKSQRRAGYVVKATEFRAIRIAKENRT